MRRFRWGIGLGLVTLGLTSTSQAQSLLASYTFNNSLGAAEVGRPALTAIDPLSANTFETQTVFGNSRTVYRTSGTASSQAGLTLNTSGFVPSTSYTLELVFANVNNQSSNGWRRIFDSQNTSDNGLYIDGTTSGAGVNKIDLWDNVASPGTTTINAGEFNYLALTVDSNTARVYVNGNLEITKSTASMNIGGSGLLRFFLDDGIDEYGDARVALIKLYDAPLSSGQVASHAPDPFAPLSGGAAAPEPGTLALLTLGGLGLLRRRR